MCVEDCFSQDLEISLNNLLVYLFVFLGKQSRDNCSIHLVFYSGISDLSYTVPSVMNFQASLGFYFLKNEMSAPVASSSSPTCHCSVP